MKSSTILALAAAAVLVSVGCAPQPAPVAEAPPAPELVSDVVTAAEQQAMTPEAVLADLKAGNDRFVAGKLTARDYLAQAEATAANGQFPKATILSCVDSRVPVELIFDQGIGDLFVGRVAGNVEDVNMVGSFEFATKVAGSKVIVILGHTSCGAIKGAADGVELGNLTELLNDFDAPIARADEATEGEANSSNKAFLNLAIEENVRQTISDLLDQSEVISELVDSGDLLVVGGIYDLATGRVTWLDS
ncbi:MAG: carbonic anhydrase family protein [Thermoanaerobaculales bacterium]|jgi:carbonic anhydrase|nr:carbonic anhydrase family protein [Thermoanaerobaculales bacterium]